MIRAWRKQLVFLIMATLLSGALVLPVQAASAPNVITYQGRLLNSNGVPVTNSSVNMSFALYTAVTGGTCLWSNSSSSCASITARSVTLTTGLFTENLGDTTASYAAIGDAVFGDNASVYLEVIVGGETLSPRRQMTAAPYALNADTLDGIDSTILQLFETGSSRTFEDDASVIVGANSAFTYGSGGIGDLRVADELEVMGNGYLDNNLVVGASTSVTETIANAGFVLGGDDLFVAGMLGVEGAIFTDGAIDAADFTCTDCLDFTELSDTLTLDASTSIAMDGSKVFTITNAGSGDFILNLASTGDFVIQDNGVSVFTIQDTEVLTYITDLTTTNAMTFTGNSLTSANLLTLTASALTTGSAFSVNATNANTANSSSRLGQFSFTNSQSVVANSNISGLFLSFTNNPSVAGNTERAMVISNASTSNTTDNVVSSLLLLDNADTSVTGSTMVTDALLITASGGIANGVIDAIDVSDVNIDNALNVGDNDIEGTTATITFTDFTLDADGLVVFSSDGSGDQISMTGNNVDYQALVVNTATAITNTSGIIDLNLSQANGNGATGIDISLTQNNGVTTGNNAIAQNITLTGNDADGDMFGIVITAEPTATATVGTYEAAISIDNAENTAGSMPDAILITSTGIVGAVTDAVDASNVNIVNALNVGPNNIEGTTATITFTDFSVDDDGLMVFTSDGLGDQITMTGNHADYQGLVATTATALVNTSGFIDLNLNAANANGVSGLDLSLTQNDGATTGNNAIAQNITLTGNDADGDMFGIVITGAATANAAAGTYEAAISIDNAENTAGSMPDAILITSSGINTGVTDAIDASAANIDNALNFGANTILGTTGNIDMTHFDVVGSSGNVTTSGDVALNGNLNLLAATEANIQFANGAALSFQDASANNVMLLQDLDGSTSHTIIVDANTALAFDSSADSDVDITTATNETLRILPDGTGDLILGVDANSVVEISSSVAPQVDMATITNSTATATTDVNALRINYSVTGVSTSALSIASTYVGGVTDGLTYASLMIEAAAPTNAAGTDTYIGLDLGTLTDPGSSGITSSGIRIGSGYDANLTLNDTTSVIDISNGGTLVFGDGANNSLLTLTDNGSDGTLTINHLTSGASTVNLYDDAVTRTLDIGGVTSNATDTINIATHSTSADTLTIGNSHTSTTITITGGNDWSVAATGVPTFRIARGNAYTEALCYSTNDAEAVSLIEDCVGSANADYAELYPIEEGVNYGEIVVPGTELVRTYDDQQGEQFIAKAVRSTQPYQGPVYGIVSNNYHEFTSAGYNIDEADNPMPVALVGRVPVKVVDEGGLIQIGNYLTTSSTPGAAMRATGPGRVIGMALENWNGASDTVMVQVNNSWYMGEMLASDGTSDIVTDNVIISEVGTANADETVFNSYGLMLRGSAWNGSEAQTVELMLQNIVDDQDQYRLSIRNTVETEVAYITNEGTMKVAGDMIIGGYLYPSDRGVPQTEKYIYYDGSSGSAGDFMRTNAKGWSTGSYDFAQMFPSDEELVSGDIVAFAGIGERVRRASGVEGEQLAGIVSTRPGFLAGENVEGAFPVALAGRVPTKVSVENGAITAGDPLTASGASGVAMKAIDDGQIIGYALESYTGSETDNLILVSVNVGYWSAEASSITIAHNVASEASSNPESLAGLNMSGNIYMGTNSILSIGRLEGIGNVWSIESDGTIKTTGSLKTVTESYQGTNVETVAVTSPENMITLTGTATLDDGRAEIRFESVIPEFNDVISAIAPIRVIVTPSGPVSLYVSEKDQNHFVVERFVGVADVEFDWMVSGYRKGYEPVEEEEEVEEVAQVGEMIDEESGLEEEPAAPESPDTAQVDSATEDDGGPATEPSDVVIEESSTTQP